MPYRSRRRSRRAYWAAGAVSAIALAALVAAVLLVTHRHDDGAARHPLASARDDPTRREAGRDHDQRKQVHSERDAHMPGRKRREDAASLLSRVSGDLPSVSDGPHHAVLTVTSTSGTVVAVRYAFRTGHTIRKGQTTAEASWQEEATVNGIEPVAVVIGQVASGTVTCTASIDGRTVSSRTRSGPFATAVCGA